MGVFDTLFFLVGIPMCLVACAAALTALRRAV